MRTRSSLNLLLWLAAALFLLLYLYLNLISLRGQTLTDFHIYYEALGRAARGEPIYDIRSGMPFLYPPFYLVLCRPFGWMSESVAMEIWLYLQSAFLLVALVALLGVAGRPSTALAAGALILFTAYSPVSLNTLYGQTNPLNLALVSLFALGYARSERGAQGAIAWEILAALALSAAISIRVLPLALLAMAIIQRRWRVVMFSMVFVAVEALVAGAHVGFATQFDYFTSYMFQLRGHENMREISLLALFERLLPRRMAMIAFAGAVAAAIALFAALALRPMARRRSPAALNIAFVVTSMVLFAPLLEYHHYVLLLAPMVLVLGWLEATGRAGVITILPVIGSWAVVSCANQLSHFRYGAVAFAALAGAALLWGYALWLMRRPAGQTIEPWVL